MVGYVTKYFFGGVFVAFSVVANAQFSAVHSAEFQHGNIPGVEPSDMNSLYDNIQMQYRLKALKASLRFEQYYMSDTLPADYFRVSQWNMGYQYKNQAVEVGHFYETIGNGLLLRAYEIKSGVLEDRIYRVKQGFYKDIYGGTWRLSGKWGSVKVLAGTVSNNQFPITLHDHRTNKIAAAEAKLFMGRQYVGFAALNSRNMGVEINMASLLLRGTVSDALTYNMELAFDATSNPLKPTGGQPRGIYVNSSWSGDGFGLSLELKDYRKMFIGTGLADPPTLVKEYSYRLLNRSTHVSDLNNERGYQFEAFFVGQNGNMLTINHSLAQNRLFSHFLYRSAFAEYAFDTNGSNQIKLYSEYSKDDIKLEKNRLTFGGYWVKRLSGAKSVQLETGVQRLQRVFLSGDAYNSYVGLTYAHSAKLSLTADIEHSNDQLIRDNPSTQAVETSRLFPGFYLNYELGKKRRLQLFAGERRGGPACTGGICYEVLDFKGVELKYSARF